MANKVNSRKPKPSNKYWLFEKTINSQLQLYYCQKNKLMKLYIE